MLRVGKSRTLLFLFRAWNPVHQCNQIYSPISNSNSTKHKDQEEPPKGPNGIKPGQQRSGMLSPGGSGCRVSLDKRGRSFVVRSEEDSMRPTVR